MEMRGSRDGEEPKWPILGYTRRRKKITVLYRLEKTIFFHSSENGQCVFLFKSDLSAHWENSTLTSLKAAKIYNEAGIVVRYNIINELGCSNR